MPKTEELHRRATAGCGPSPAMRIVDLSGERVNERAGPRAAKSTTLITLKRYRLSVHCRHRRHTLCYRCGSCQYNNSLRSSQCFAGDISRQSVLCTDKRSLSKSRMHEPYSEVQ